MLELGAREGDLYSRGGFVLELGAREGDLCSRGGFVLELEGISVCSSSVLEWGSEEK